VLTPERSDGSPVSGRSRVVERTLTDRRSILTAFPLTGDRARPNFQSYHITTNAMGVADDRGGRRHWFRLLPFAQ
jgi:hypothetical protein